MDTLDADYKKVEALKKELTSANRSKLKFCCNTLRQQVVSHCKEHGYECPDWLIAIGVSGIKNPKLSWFGHAVNATYAVKFCPWCGGKLPSLENLIDNSTK